MRKFILLVVLVGKAIVLLAQLSDNSIPESFMSGTKNLEILPSFQLDSVFVQQRILEDEQQGISNRYGVVQEIGIDIKKTGIKSSTKDFNVWRYEINCPDAFSLGLFFEKYDLPEGAGVYLYNKDKTLVRGAFTSANNKDNGRLAIADFPGKAVILEYDEPVNAAFPGELIIGSVSKAYISLKSVANSWVGINCPEGEDWQDEKRAVCLISFDEGRYSYYCSGALINNVRLDETPYFLTANHCLNNSLAAETLVAYFNFENTSCESDDASMEQTLSGAELVATGSYTDFTLLELAETPPEDYLPYFAGWNAGSDQPTSGTSIHHPEGSYKCIAFEYDAPYSYPYAIQWDNSSISMPNTHWEVSYDVGTDESGSSGCPLFDQNKHVIGQLHGGDDTSSDFGKFSLSWNYSSSTSEQLKHWLDPDNTGTLRLDGTDFNSPPEAEFSVDVPLACLYNAVYFTDKSKLLPSIWHWEFEPTTVEFINGTDSSSQNPQIVFTEPGYYSAMLIASNKNGSDTVTYENIVEAVSNLDVNFSDFEDELRICGNDLQDFLMIASGANDYTFEVYPNGKFDFTSSSDSLIITLKDEVRSDGSFDGCVKVTGSHGDCFDSDSVLLRVIMPANDDMVDAATLKLGRNTLFSNECGTVEDKEPQSSNLLTDNTVWFVFQGPTSGEMDIVIDGAATFQAVYKADSYSSLASGNYDLIAYSSSSSFLNENKGLGLDPGEKYWLQIGAMNNDFGDLIIDLLSNSLEVHPNPSTGKFYFTLSSKENGTAEIDIYSLNGQLLIANSSNFTLDSNTFELDLSNQVNGVYILRAIINGESFTKKIVVAR